MLRLFHELFRKESSEACKQELCGYGVEELQTGTGKGLVIDVLIERKILEE